MSFHLGRIKLHQWLIYSLLFIISSFVSIADANACNMQAATKLIGASYSWSGQCADGLPNGYGVAAFSNGRVYVGTMAAGLFAGNGTLSLPDGTRYTGEFIDGKYQGQGVYTFTNGDRYIGGFETGEMHGTGVFRPAGSDERYQVEYLSGERVRFELEVQAASLLREPLTLCVRIVVVQEPEIYI